MSAELVNAIKKASSQVIANMDLANVIFGTVKSINPLKIQVDTKLVLTEAFLVLTDNVRDYKVYMTVDHETEEEETDHFHPFTDVTPGGAVPSQTQAQNMKHKHAYTGKKLFTVHNALKFNETVILIQQKGGQKYIVLDRVDAREEE